MGVQCGLEARAGALAGGRSCQYQERQQLQPQRQSGLSFPFSPVEAAQGGEGDPALDGGQDPEQ